MVMMTCVCSRGGPSFVRLGSGEDEDLRGEQDGRRERGEVTAKDDLIQRLRWDERGLRETVLAAERPENAR